jgi:hypothetical protein
MKDFRSAVLELDISLYGRCAVVDGELVPLFGGSAGDPLQATGYRTNRPELPEDLWQPIYDRMNYATGGTIELDFFTQQVGSSVTLIRGTATSAITKTLRDTNITNSAVMPAKMFKVMGISIGYIHAGLTNITNQNDRSVLRNNSYVKFNVIDKNVLTIPTLAIPEMNPIVAAATTTNATNSLVEVGGGGPGIGMYVFPVPLVIMPYENFGFAQIFDGSPTVTTAADLVWFLHAFMRRPT